jgi:uncharacterized membrane protein
MKYAALLLIALLISSCSYRVEKEGETAVKLNANALGFSEVQAAILGPKCARCHGFVASYEGVVANLDAIAARTQSADPGFMMPPPGRGSLTAEEKAALQSWIDRGAPQVGEGGGPVTEPTSRPDPIPAPPPVKPALSFAFVQQQVFTPRCAKCHGGMVGSYESVVAKLTEIESRVRSTFEWEQMPPPRASQLTEEEKNLLLDWIKAGAPQVGEGEAPAPRPDPSPAPPKNCDDDDHDDDDLVTHKKCDERNAL